ncbi:MAG: transglutaminase family protein [Candidatus Poribacteria bacterium]|nr:transglutaminase family protein [Candidatus Poribacteria bacterium]
MNYKIVHKTEYSYTHPVNLCYNETRLSPRSFAHQDCSESQFVVAPEPRECRERQDFFGNTVYYFTIQQPHNQLTVTVTSRVSVKDREMQLNFAEHITWEEVRQQLQTDQNPGILEMRQYILDSPMVPMMSELHAYAEKSFTKGKPLLEAVNDLTTRLYTDFTYDPGFTTIATPLADVIEHRRGVCQDFAHLGIGCLRALGLAARYISGYIETVPPPDQELLAGADASHAWFSVYLPQLGWVDFDPTNNQIPADQHITIAWGRDYADVTPLKGVVFGSGTHELSVSVDCKRENF